MAFALFESPGDTAQVGTTITNCDISVTAGLFIATLNFGDHIFTGQERWLEISVRTNGASDFITLNPRQLLTPTPYAIMAKAASNLLGTLPAGQLIGTLTDSQVPPNLARLS